MDQEKYLIHLKAAEKHAQIAFKALHSPGKVKRPLWYRITLGNAQSALLTLLVREQNWLEKNQPRKPTRFRREL